MAKYKKFLFIIFIIFFSFQMFSCSDSEQEHICEDNLTEWDWDKEYACETVGTKVRTCTVCEKVIYSENVEIHHEFETVVIDATCEENGSIKDICKRCNLVNETPIAAIGHDYTKLVVTTDGGKDGISRRNCMCEHCDKVIAREKFANNGYFAHGKLSVNGADLVDKDGEKFQLYGLSTHGLQWYGRVVNFDNFKALQTNFGLNIIRLAMYTDENGYCSGGEKQKENMLTLVERGIEAATKLGLYVIVDWHMVGAENPKDKNPRYYMDEAKEFFSYISEKYKDYDNILYEIMNEPNGSTTWYDCKYYAEQVIPCIRANTDAIILVGNPHWTADLNSVMNNPLKGFDNIMYTYHFYAADHPYNAQVPTAYKKGFPVFISEFGMMKSSGDGALDTNAGEFWINKLDSMNISYVAWNISSSKGSASIFKYGASDYTDVSDSNLKEWGVYLKNWYREKSGLDN